MIALFNSRKNWVSVGTVSVLVGSVLFCGLPSFVQGQAIDPLTGLAISSPAIDPLTGLPVVQAPTQAVTQAPVTTAAPVSTPSTAPSSGVIRVNLRAGATANFISTATARVALRTPTTSSSATPSTTRVSTRGISAGASSTGVGTSTGGNTQVNASGNAFGKGSESVNIVDMGGTSGTIDLIFATGPQTDRMTAYYPPRGQAGSAQIKDTGEVATPNNGKDIANGVPIQITFGPGTGTLVEIVVNEGSTVAAGTIWSYTGTGTGANGSTITINGGAGATSTAAPSIPARIMPVIPRGVTRVNLRSP